MITRGQAASLQSSVGTWFGILLIGSFAFLMGLLIWQSAFNENPIANAMATAMYSQTQLPN